MLNKCFRILLLFNLIINGFSDELTQKLPNAIIIGTKKSGTRALLKFIGAHPNVSTAGAEVHFFDRFYHMGLDWYREQMPFSNDNQITIEKTPKYFVDKHVPRRVFRMNPKIKLIVVLRNPVDRTISEYVQSKENRMKKRRIINKNLARNNHVNDSAILQQMIYDENGKIKLDKNIIRNSLYITHLKHWLKFFSLDQFIFINGEALVKTPSTELKRIESFLNLKHVFKEEDFVFNKEKGFPCIRKPLDSDKIKCLNDQKGRKHPNILPGIKADLEKFYQPYNKKLFETIGQEPWWP